MDQGKVEAVKEWSPPQNWMFIDSILRNGKGEAEAGEDKHNDG